MTPDQQTPLRIAFIPGANGGHDGKALETAGYEQPCPTPIRAPGCSEIVYDTDAYSEGSADKRYSYSDVVLDADQNLASVDFSRYDVIVVGATSAPLNIDTLVKRKQELYDYVNGGGGLIVLSPNHVVPDCDNLTGAPKTQESCYRKSSGQVTYREGARYLPFLDDQEERDTLQRTLVTKEGQQVGIDPTDPLGLEVWNWFPCAIGEAFETFAVDGRIATLGTHQALPPSQICGKVPDVTVNEGNSATTKATFAVSLDTTDTNRSTSRTVNYSTAASSATEGSTCATAGQEGGTDYLASSGTLTFPPGDVGPNRHRRGLRRPPDRARRDLFAEGRRCRPQWQIQRCRGRHHQKR
ncbi:MAG: hypothetical protein ACR2FO_05485 [Actinomycetota bacterium]